MQSRNVSLPLRPSSQRKRKAKKKTQKKKRGRRSVQSRILDSELSQYDDGWGDSIDIKSDDLIRVVSKNIGGLRLMVNNEKELHLKEWIKQQQVDLIGVQETNINWSLCSDRERPLKRFQSQNWSIFRGSSSHNKHDKKRKKKTQYGGTLSLAFEKTATYVDSTGADDTGLGRWSWLLIRSLNFSVRFISAYKPIPTRTAKKCRTVYMQHRKYWLRRSIDEDPNILFERDLLSQIRKWRQKGERIILTIDLNEDVCSAQFSEQLNTLGLHSAIRSRHGSYNVPATQHTGSRPIDDIYITKDILCLRSGFCAFGDGPGDHRSLFADLSLECILGEAPQKIVRPPARRLNSKLTKVVEKFNQLFKQKVFDNHVPVRMNTLCENIQFPLSKQQQIEYEKCDNIQHSAFAFAASRCRKLHMGHVPFVPEKVQVYGLEIRLWRLVLRRKKGIHVGVRHILSLANFLNIKDPLYFSLEEVLEKRAIAWKHYDEGKIRAYYHRPSWLRERRDKYTLNGQHQQAKEVDQIILNEATRTAHLHIRAARDKFNKKGTFKLTIPSSDDPNEMTVITDKDAIEEVLMETNEKKFRSAENTPLLHGQLFQDLGQRAMTYSGDLILKGEYDVSDKDEGVREFLTEVKIPTPILESSPIQAHISPQDHKQYWERAREATQSSISGMDFSFYKSVVQDEELNAITSTFIDIPFRSGYTPNRWRRSLNVHIMKEDNNFKPEKQRTIHLIEASFSEGAKIIFSKRMMENARLKKVIPQDQYARKGGKAIEAVLHKVLFYDFLRSTRFTGIIVANDMHSCYDRMVHSATSLALRSLGAPSPAVECMSGVIQSMEHFVRTAYGDSSRCYGGDKNNPL